MGLNCIQKLSLLIFLIPLLSLDKQIAIVVYLQLPFGAVWLNLVAEMIFIKIPLARLKINSTLDFAVSQQAKSLDKTKRRCYTKKCCDKAATRFNGSLKTEQWKRKKRVRRNSEEG